MRAALQAGDFDQLEDGGVRVAGHDLTREEVLVERHGKDGWAVAASTASPLRSTSISTTSLSARVASTISSTA